jgi:hypothetical protein
MASSAEAEDDLLVPSVPEARVVPVTQWIPHGQLLVPDSPPEADSRMANFPGLNDGGHTGYHELRRQAGAWPTTEATPDGPAGMLSTSRDLYAQSYYAYALMAVGCTSSSSPSRQPCGSSSEQTGRPSSAGWSNRPNSRASSRDRGGTTNSSTPAASSATGWSTATSTACCHRSSPGTSSAAPTRQSPRSSPTKTARGLSVR